MIVRTSAFISDLLVSVCEQQILCEDIHRPSGVGEDGASVQRRLSPGILLQRPDSESLAHRNQGVQGRLENTL